MKESQFEDILERYPDLIEIGLALEGRQVALGRLHVDLLFRDKHAQLLIIELKQGPILRDHIAQIFDYEGHLLTGNNPNVRVMLIGNRVPPNIRKSLDHHGFEWREFTQEHLINHLQNLGDKEFLSYFEVTKVDRTSPIKTETKHENFTMANLQTKSTCGKFDKITTVEKMRLFANLGG